MGQRQAWLDQAAGACSLGVGSVLFPSETRAHRRHLKSFLCPGGCHNLWGAEALCLGTGRPASQAALSWAASVAWGAGEGEGEDAPV